MPCRQAAFAFPWGGGGTVVQPSLDELMQRVDSKYALVVLAAKRARELMETVEVGEEPREKPVTWALREVAEGKIHYRQPVGGIK